MPTDRSGATDGRASGSERVAPSSSPLASTPLGVCGAKRPTCTRPLNSWRLEISCCGLARTGHAPHASFAGRRSPTSTGPAITSTSLPAATRRPRCVWSMTRGMIRRTPSRNSRSAPVRSRHSSLARGLRTSSTSRPWFPISEARRKLVVATKSRLLPAFAMARRSRDSALANFPAVASKDP